MSDGFLNPFVSSFNLFVLFDREQKKSEHVFISEMDPLNFTSLIFSDTVDKLLLVMFKID